MTDTERKLYEQLEVVNNICASMGLVHQNRSFLDVKPWAVSVGVVANLNQVHEIVQKASEKGVKVILCSTDDDIDEWRDPLFNPIKFDLDIEEEQEPVLNFDDIDE